MPHSREPLPSCAWYALTFPPRSNVVKIVYLGLAAFASGYVEITLCTLSGAGAGGGVQGAGGMFLLALLGMRQAVPGTESALAWLPGRPTSAGRSLASGVRGRFLESVLKQDAAWHETGACPPGGWRGVMAVRCVWQPCAQHTGPQPTVAPCPLLSCAPAGGAMGTVIRGLNEDTASYQDAVGDRLGNFCRNVSTTVTALIVCESGCAGQALITASSPCVCLLAARLPAAG